MKSWYAAAFILTALILCFCIAKTNKSGKRIAVTLKKVLLLAVLAVLANLILMFSESESVCMAAYGAFFVCIDWLLYYVLIFVLEYCGYSVERHIKKRVLCLLLALDSASMLLNLFFHHAFVCQQVWTPNGEIYYRITDYLPYRIHLLLSYLLVCASVFCLAYKACKSPPLFRKKYLLVLIMLLAVVVGDGVYVFLNRVIDGSILGFAAVGIILYYYSVVYIPKELLDRTLSMVVQEMTDAILLFDAEGKCVHANDSARRLLGIRYGGLKEQEEIFATWSKATDLSACEDFTCDKTQRQNGKEVHVKIFFHRLLDENAKYLGCFFNIQDRTEEVNSLKRQRHLATHDRLTDLYNKEYFYEQAERQLKMHPDERFLMVCSDVKNFKLVNDIFGTKAGDELLIKIADVLRGRSLPGHIYGRMGDDKYCLMMPKREYIEQTFLDESQETMCIDSDISYPVNIYLGVYEITDPSIPVSVMCDRAFMALGTIKGSYQKKIAYYNNALRDSALREQELTGELSQAMEQGQFRIYLQPQITAAGKVPGAEALVRWLHPQKGLLMPGEFIEIFEKNGMIVKLDQYVWELACIQLKKWKELGREDLYLSVNISPKDFYFVDVCSVFMELIEKYKIHPHNLKLEITETAVMLDLEKQLLLIERLRQAGFIVEMDDFGSGYSSLNMLKDIQVDVLKIDMAFLGRTEHEERARKILEMMITLSRQLGMPVITEGVESLEQVDFLTGIGCDMFQGFYFARPMEIGTFEERYMEIPAGIG